MRILTILHSHTLGGAERHALGLMRSLKEKGHDVLFAGPRDSWIAEQLIQAGIGVEHLPMHGFFDLGSMLRLARLARRFRADIMHGHLTRGAHYVGIASQLTGIPSVATAHSTNAGKHFGRTNHIIAVCEAVRSFLISQGYDSNSITSIYNGVTIPSIPTKTRDTVRARWGISPCTPVFGMVARFITDKGQDIALEAFAQAGTPGLLILAGDVRTAWGKAMQQRAATLGLTDKVRFLGQQDDVFPVLAAMDVFLAPSRREAFALSILEAMGMGLPVLGAKVGGIPEVVDHEENGLLLPPEDISAWSGAIGRIANDADLRRAMGERGRHTYQTRFTHEVMVQATLGVYQRAFWNKPCAASRS